jgi:hypothetical protein
VRTKKSKPATKIHPGHVERRRVRCGKPNCKCARGEYHVAHYHVWHADGRRFRQYIRRAQVAEVREGCAEYRETQAEIRRGRKQYRQTLARSRELIRFLEAARKAGWV